MRAALLTIIAILTTGCVFQSPAESVLTVQNLSTGETLQLGFSEMRWTERADLYEAIGTGRYDDEHELVMSLDDPATRPSNLRYLHLFTTGTSSNWEDYYIELLIPAETLGLASADRPDLLLFHSRLSPPQKTSMNRLRFRVPHITLRSEMYGVPSLQVNGEIIARHIDDIQFDEQRMEYDRLRRDARAAARAAAP